MLFWLGVDLVRFLLQSTKKLQWKSFRNFQWVSVLMRPLVSDWILNSIVIWNCICQSSFLQWFYCFVDGCYVLALEHVVAVSVFLRIIFSGFLPHKNDWVLQTQLRTVVTHLLPCSVLVIGLDLWTILVFCHLSSTVSFIPVNFCSSFKMLSLEGFTILLLRTFCGFCSF